MQNTPENLSEKLYEVYQELNYAFKEGALFYPSDIKTIRDVANDLLALINDPLIRVYDGKISDFVVVEGKKVYLPL